MSLPPLLGDANGRYRIRIVGNCGAGKSTVGKRLADILGVPFISLDALYWNPDWVQSSPSELRKKVAQALAAAPNGWVVDGNYSVKAGTMIDDAETDVIWLDPPLALTLSRVIRRTFLRLLRLVPPCSPGCSERFTEVFFSKSSVVWWCISHHWRLRRRQWERMDEMGLSPSPSQALDSGGASDGRRRRMRRIGGWGDELERWFVDVARMLRSKYVPS